MDSVSIVSFHNPVPMISASRKNTRIPTVRPARMKARSVTAISVSHHGDSARTPWSGLRIQMVNHSLPVTVTKSRLLVIHSSSASATPATCLPKFSDSGKTANQRTCRDSTIATIVKSPPATSPIRRRTFAASEAAKPCWSRLTAAVVARSSRIARQTTASPATTPSPTLRMISASMTGLPRPGAPISAAMTTKDSAASVVWLTARIRVLLAIGSCTLVSSCHRVDPAASAASMGPALRDLMA